MTRGSILIVEDETLVARDLAYLLEDQGYQIVATAATSDEALAAVRAHLPDLVLLDVHLAKGTSGLSVAEWLRDHVRIPVIFLSANADPATVARAETTVPYGYLLKPFNQRELEIAVQLAVTRGAADRAIRTSERQLTRTLQHIDEAVILTDTADQITYLNRRAELFTGWAAAEAIGQLLPTILVLQPLSADEQPPAQPDHGAHQVRLLVPRAGAACPIEEWSALLDNEVGDSLGTAVIFRDATATLAQQRLTRRLLEAQRLETVGLISGGIAHDFNNVLTSVCSQLDRADTQLAPTSPARPALARASIGLRHAAGLTTQLLAHVSDKAPAATVFQLNTSVREICALLHGQIVPRASLKLQLTESLSLVRGNVTQINQVVMNMLTNAIEACGATYGTIRLQTEPIALTDAQCDTLGVARQPSGYVRLTVHDTGCGMSLETLTRIFDPFYTTKGAGRGLGLAAIQTIVREHAGALTIESQPGSGTIFQVYLPATAVAVANAAITDSQPALSAQIARTLLLIDDEPLVRDVLARLLERRGFAVQCASDAAAALELLATRETPFAGILLDLSLPLRHTDQLLHTIQQRHADTPLIVMSGHDAVTLAPQYPALQPHGFLQKPFSPVALDAVLTALLVPVVKARTAHC